MTKKPVSLIATLFLALISLGHLLRVLFRVEVTAGIVVVPIWMSVVACLATGILAILLWRETQRK
jgi:hypothetical protein